MDKAILFPFIIWGLFTAALLLRKGIKTYAKLFLLIVLGAYIYFWRAELAVLLKYQNLNYIEILIETVKYAHTTLIWIWPLSLLFAIYSSNDKDSTIMITILTIYTVFIWTLYAIFR